MVCYTSEGEMGEREEGKNCYVACTPGRGAGKGSAIYPGVEWPTTRVDSRDRSAYPGVEWPTSRVDSRDRSVYPLPSLGGRSFNPPP